MEVYFSHNFDELLFLGFVFPYARFIAILDTVFSQKMRAYFLFNKTEIHSVIRQEFTSHSAIKSMVHIVITILFNYPKKKIMMMLRLKQNVLSVFLSCLYLCTHIQHFQSSRLNERVGMILVEMFASVSKRLDMNSG